MKKIPKIKILILLLLTLLLIPGCKKNNNKLNKDSQTTYQVTYNLMGGSYQDSLDNIIVNVKANTLVENIQPKKDGFTFKGWSYELKKETLYNFEQSIKENIIFYAIWEKKAAETYSIFFDSSNGFFGKYLTIDDLIDDFLNDFSNYCGATITRENFFYDSYNKVSGSNGFFNQPEYKDKWLPMIRFLSTVASKNAQPYFNKLKDNPGIVLSSLEQATIRVEINAFLLQNIIIRGTWPIFTTSDYNDIVINEQIWSYYVGETPTEYDNSVDYILPIPHRLNHYFIGWVKPDDLTQTIVTKIPANTCEDLSFKALWHEYAFLNYELNLDDFWKDKQSLFNDFFTDFYRFIVDNNGNEYLTENNINNVNDFLTLAGNYNAGRGEMRAIGDLFGDWFLQKDIGGTADNQPTTKFIGYCYQNNKYKPFIDFLIKFFAFWREDEGYTTPTNNGSDFFAESWAALVDTCKFFYYDENTSYVKTNRIRQCFLNIPNVLRKNLLPLVYTGQYTMNLTFLTIKGYNFCGWYTTSDFSGNPVNYLNYNYSGNITLYAKWETATSE